MCIVNLLSKSATNQKQEDNTDILKSDTVYKFNISQFKLIELKQATKKGPVINLSGPVSPKKMEKLKNHITVKVLVNQSSVA